MKKFVFTILTLLITYAASAQIIDNKINIYFGYSMGSFLGPKNQTKGNFNYSSLFRNYKNVTGATFKVLYKYKSYYSVGFTVNYIHGTNWQLVGQYNYDGSGVKLYQFAPVIQFHNKYAQSSFGNRFKFFVEFEPLIGYTDISLGNKLFDIQGQAQNNSQPVTERDMFGGIGGSAGLEVVVYKILGLYFSYSVSHVWLKSNIFLDKNITSGMFHGGIIIRLKRNQRLFY